VTAVNNANVGSDGSPQALLDGFHPAIVVSVVAGLLGLLAVAVPLRRRRTAELVVPAAEEALEEAA
jgi:hypothetical protein